MSSFPLVASLSGVDSTMYESFDENLLITSKSLSGLTKCSITSADIIKSKVLPKSNFGSSKLSSYQVPKS